MMTRMPLLAATVLGGRRRLAVDLWATAPSAFNWQEPLGQEPVPPLSTWSSEATVKFLFVACLVGFVLACCAMIRLYCCNKKDDDQDDTSRFVLGNNDGDGEGMGSLPPPLEEQQPLPANGDGLRPRSNTGEEGDRPSRRRRRRRQQPPAVAEMPAADVEMALGDVPLTQAGVEWMLANLEWLAPVADVDMEPMTEEEITPAQEPGPSLKCMYRTADGWAEGTCSVCLSELVDGEMVRVLTACMHCFHATCIETWLRGGNANCPLCRAPVMILPGRRRRRRRTQA